jgi:hypothetical protein
MNWLYSPTYGLLDSSGSVAPTAVVTGVTRISLLQNSGLTLPISMISLLLSGTGDITAYLRRGGTTLRTSLPVTVSGHGVYRFVFLSPVLMMSSQAHLLQFSSAVDVICFSASDLSAEGISAPAFRVYIGSTLSTAYVVPAALVVSVDRSWS